MDGRTEPLYPRLGPAAPVAVTPAPTVNNNNAEQPLALSIVNTFEAGQAHDREKAIRAREDSKTLTAAQIYATLKQQQKDDLFAHYMQKLIATTTRLEQQNLPYADLAKQAQEQLLAAYNDKVFGGTHKPEGQDLVVITQQLGVALDAPLTVDGAPNPNLLAQLTELDKLAKNYRSTARLETFLGVVNLLLAAIVAAATVAMIVLTLGTMVLPTMACVVGLWAGTAGVAGLMLGAGAIGSASLFHDARRHAGLANVLQPLAEKVTEHVSPPAPVANRR